MILNIYHSIIHFDELIDWVEAGCGESIEWKQDNLGLIDQS